MAMIIVSLLALVCVSYTLPISQQTLPTQPTEQSVTLSRNYAQDVACAIEDLTKASRARLPYVELQPCPSPGYSCVPEISGDLMTQMDIVEGYTHYIGVENITENFSAPEELLDLLDVINGTLSSLRNNEASSNFRPNVPECESDPTFQSNCTVHLLNSTLHHLMLLYHNTLPSCTFCTSLTADEERDMNRLYLFFSGDYLDQLLPFQCRFLFYFAQYQLPSECTSDTYALHSRLSDLTQWLNDTLVLMDQPKLELEELVQTLSVTVLPSTARILNRLRGRDSCTGSERCTAPGLELHLVESAASQFALEYCFPDHHQLSAITVQIFDLVRQTFNSLYDHLLIEEIINL